MISNALAGADHAAAVDFDMLQNAWCLRDEVNV